MGIRDYNRLIICNSFGAPFEDNQQACYVDDRYIQQMAGMYNKVFSDEELVGYYTTDPQFRVFDNELASRMYNIVKKKKCILLNVDCLEQDNY